MSKGVSLYFSIIILCVLSVTLLALMTFSISQIKVIWTLGDSVNAFYAADTGIEECLFRVRQLSELDDFSGTLDGASYQVTITLGTETVIRSVGAYKDTKRGIETRY